MDPDPSAISVEHLTNLPIFHPDHVRYVHTVVVPKLAWVFSENADDLEQEFWLKVMKSSHLLEHIEYPKSWSWTAVRNLCLNRKRDTRRERNCTVSMEGLQINDLIDENADLFSSVQNEPDEKPPVDERKAQLRKKILDIINTLPARDARVVYLWLRGTPVNQIAGEIGRSKQTVYRVKKPAKLVMKRIVNELGLEARAIEDSGLNETLAELVTSCLREGAGGEYAWC